jgi:beta-glucosidase
MCSYNKVYGYHSCENSKLLKELLRDDLGFRGVVMSDWDATHTAEWSAKGGLDVEMPGGPAAKFNQLSGLVGQGTVPQETIDHMAGHVLAAMHFVGHYEGKFSGSGTCITGVDATSDEHRAVARRTIIEGAVLLKNDGGALPIATAGKKIALIGQYCNKAEWISAYMGRASPFMGGGSGYVPTKRTVPPFQGMQARVKDAASLTWSADASAGAGADVAVVCASYCDVHEGWDRPNFTLPEAEELLTSLRNQGGDKKIILVGVVPGEVTTEWLDKADAALMLFMPGEQIGPALAQLLTGDVGPGGRLPISLPRDGEMPQGERFTNEQYPGIQSKEHPWGKHLTAQYSEGVLTGYRWYNAHSVEPKFPFGHGLAYTEFEFKDHVLKCFKVGSGSNSSVVAALSLTVANVGERDGTAVPQVYVGFHSLKPALRYLRGFTKVKVPRSGEASVTFTLGEDDWSYYDEGGQKWNSALDKGEDIIVSVGSSSGAMHWNATLSCPS